jgi:quercetin dioxygenase-like cupin family protein
MEFFRAGESVTFSNSGITSNQLVCPEDSRSERITITHVTVATGAKNPPHRHNSSEQIWIALRGFGHLLLADNKIMPFSEGDVIRFEDNDLHGFVNSGAAEFQYLSVTSLPVNFRNAYAKEWK